MSEGQGAAGAVNAHAWRSPAAGLRDYVDTYIGYRQTGGEPGLHRGLPSPWLTLIFTLDDPLVLMAHPDPAQPPGVFHAIVGGLHTSPAMISHQGCQSGIQLGLSPLGASALLGVPSGELTSLDLAAEEVLGPLAAEILDRVRCAASWPDRFSVLDETLLARLGAARPSPPVNRETTYAWRRLLQTGGRESVADLAAETGWSDRHLRARFQSEVGLTPKAAARVIRFDRARRELQHRAAAGRPPALAELAATYGYFDQPHLAREFGVLAGCSPSSWLAEEFRNIQADVA